MAADTIIQDITRNNKSYRIIGEPTSICHPEGAIVAVFELTKPGHKELWKQTCEDKDIAGMLVSARAFVNGL